jgi:hypothetical protein
MAKRKPAAESTASAITAAEHEAAEKKGREAQILPPARIYYKMMPFAVAAERFGGEPIDLSKAAQVLGMSDESALRTAMRGMIESAMLVARGASAEELEKTAYRFVADEARDVLENLRLVAYSSKALGIVDRTENARAEVTAFEGGFHVARPHELSGMRFEWLLFPSTVEKLKQWMKHAKTGTRSIAPSIVAANLASALLQSAGVSADWDRVSDLANAILAFARDRLGIA